MKFIGNSGAIRDVATQAIDSETDPEKKLRKLYDRAQQIRNLSYERERTKEEQKGENLKPNSSAPDVLQHGYGTSWEIDAFFVALARAAGFQASMLGVADRHERSFTNYCCGWGNWTGKLLWSRSMAKMWCLMLEPDSAPNRLGKPLRVSWLAAGFFAVFPAWPG